MQGDITIALSDWAAGDASALDRLAPVVYPHLRNLAGAFLARERPGHLWQATALVNELFLKLIAHPLPHLDGRQHFYNLCALLMRRVLIDHARSLQRSKRGARPTHVALHEDIAWLNAAGPEIIDCDRLLTALARRDPEQAAMFEKRYLLGCTAEETAELHATSKATVDRKLRLARAWLYQHLHRPPIVPDPQQPS